MGGLCLTRNNHCHQLFGEKSKVSDTCMARYNKNDDKTGNCGELYQKAYDRAYHYSCNADVNATLCGKAMCVGGSEKVEERPDVTVSTHDGQCKYMDWTGSHDPNSRAADYNFDQMPVGTPCGPESVCNMIGTAKRKCTHLSDLWTKSEWGDCGKNCLNRGVCNSNGHCHCDDGFGGQYCETKGFGGSFESGHAVSYGIEEGTLWFTIIFALLFTAFVVAALVAKFRFKKNLTDLCLYQ